jgi:protein phosphatase
VHILDCIQEIEAASIERTRLFNDPTDETGPFDVIGDIHGCRAELESLLTSLGYGLSRDASGRPIDAAHSGRRAVFVGDLVDRGRTRPAYSGW